MDLAQRLADSLRTLREKAGLTQKDMAKRLGMSHATLHRLERGDHNTTLKTLEELRSAQLSAGGSFRGRTPESPFPAPDWTAHPTSVERSSTPGVTDLLPTTAR